MPKRKSGIALLALNWYAGKIASPVPRLRFLIFAMYPRSRDEPGRLPQIKAGLLIAFPVTLFLFTAPVAPRTPQAAQSRSAPLPNRVSVRVATASQIWQVETSGAFETYSNGLRIDTRYSVAGRPRSWLAYSAVRPEPARSERRTSPAGIVFHTTESQQAPFEPGQNSRLGRIGEWLLAHVKQRRAYNYVIDRFGRVYRVVAEDDAANHAGYSVWADSRWVYINLNQSFLAVSFETETLPGQSEATVNPAQLWSGAMLTEMLRDRYGILAEDCVTHAQVSVNPSGLRIGSHFDWASSFPFGQIGLPDNYQLPLPAITLFGFEYDSAFAEQAGERLFREAQLTEQTLLNRATAAGLEPFVYRKSLQQQYRRLTASHRTPDPEEQEE